MTDKLKNTLWPALLMLAGCTVAGEGLWPETADHAATPDRPVLASSGAAAPPAWTEPAAYSAPLDLGLPAPRQAADTGTFLGGKAAALQSDLNLLITMVTAQRDELRAVRAGTDQVSARYDTTVTGVQTALNAGTAPGNPALMAGVQSAQGTLDQIALAEPRLTDLSARVAENSGRAQYISESAEAALGVQGGVEEDKRQLTAILDDTAAVSAASQRLLSEINATLGANKSFVSAEQTNLSGLAMAVRNGNAYTGTRSWMVSTENARALIVIGFDRPASDYERALSDAIGATLNRQPDAQFELIAVMPQRGGSGADAKRNAERVLRSMMTLGLPADRVVLVSETSDLVSEGEVQVYVR